MTRSELALALAEKSHITLEEARTVIDTTFDLMKKSLMEGGRVEIRGFGSFCMKEYATYKGRNPKTGEHVDVRPKRLPFFKCGKELYDMLNDEGEEKEGGSSTSSHVVIKGAACPAFSFVDGLFKKR